KIKEDLRNFSKERDFKWIDSIKDCFFKINKMRLDMNMEEINRIATVIAEDISAVVVQNPYSGDVAVLTRFDREMRNLNIDYYRYIVQNNIAALVRSELEPTPELKELANTYNIDWERLRKL
ncbi:MAG: hypothetical protein PHQ54_05135, partial [Candidatus Omnitrophica bacterium]|nr:hypothetical protein [Candidatus Omnitrophota bacterium]